MTRQKKHTATTCDNEKLETLIGLMYQDLLHEGGRFKVMELLRALEFKRKIAPPDDREGAFWNMIDELRASELNHAAPHKPAVADLPKVTQMTISTQKKRKLRKP